MKNGPAPRLDYQNPKGLTIKPFAGAGIHLAFGIILAIAVFAICLASVRRPFDASFLFVTPPFFVCQIFSFQAAWAVRNFSGLRLVERNRGIAVACGFIAFFIPAVVVRLLRPNTINFPIPILLLILLPQALAAAAGWIAFRRTAEDSIDVAARDGGRELLGELPTWESRCPAEQSLKPVGGP